MKIVNEMKEGENNIPFMLDDEQNELEELHAESLDKPRNLNDYEPL
jgi:hypothetical protein